MYWRQITFAVMLLIIFEGALRKWVLPEAQALIYVAKDVLLLFAYAGFALSKGFDPPVRLAQPYVVLLSVSAFFGLLAMVNPSLPTFTLAIVGWRAHFFSIPLIFLVPHLFDSAEQLYRTLGRYALFAIPTAALGIVQFYSDVDSPINFLVPDAGGDNSPVGFGEVDRVRVSGSFAFISGYTAYLLAVAMLLGSLLAGREWRIRGSLVQYGTLLLIIAAMFSTGSRSPVYSLIAVAGVYAVFAALAGDLSFSAALQAAAGAALLGLVVWNFLPEPLDAFYARATGGDDELERLTSQIIEPLDIFFSVGIFGYGIGAAHQSAAFLAGTDISWWTDGLVAEAESSKIMIELGAIGFVLTYVFRIAITITAFRAAFVLKTRAARSLALMIAMFLGLQIFGAVIYNPTMNVLYWFSVGMLFALYRFDEREDA